MSQMKRCTKCGNEKELAQFHRDHQANDGRRAQCSECSATQNRTYRANNRDKLNERQRSYREEHREERSAYDRAYHETFREEIFARQRAYREEHRDEINARLRAYRRKLNAETRALATRNGEPWTPEEDHYLTTTEDTTVEAAFNLGRTYGSVQNRRAKLRRRAAEGN